MIKSKPCKRDGCSYPRLGGGYCRYDQNLRTDEPYLRKKAAKEGKPKKVYEIPKQSKKYGAELAKYNKRVKVWKEENPFCKFPGCNKATTDCHHMKSRGKYLNEEKYWVSLCREHHDIVENFPEMAKELGLSLNRLSNHDKEIQE